MKKLITKLSIIIFAFGLVSFVGCGGVKDDPNIAKRNQRKVKTKERVKMKMAPMPLVIRLRSSSGPKKTMGSLMMSENSQDFMPRTERWAVFFV
jgi:hypothetical protein